MTNEQTIETTRGQFKTAADAYKFIKAGSGTLTLVSLKTGTRFTYKIGGKEDEQTGRVETFFVRVLTGPDNERDYSYLGRVDSRTDHFWAGRRRPQPGDVAPSALSSTAFAWAWQQLRQGFLPETLEVWHEGRCGRCGLKLTVPSSVESGFGPECIKHV